MAAGRRYRMDDNPIPQPGRLRRRRDGGYLTWLAAGGLIGLGFVAFTYRSWRPESRQLDTSGFNMAQVGEPREPSLAMPAAPSVAGLSVRGPGGIAPSASAPLSSGGLGIFAPYGAASPSGVSAAANFNRALAGHARMYGAIRDRHIAGSAVVRRYFQEWRSTPALAKLAADYGRDQDVIRFAWGAVRSPKFVGLIQRYAGQPDFRSFAVEMAVGSPKDVVDAWNNYSARDATARQLASEFFRTAGLPESLAQALASGRADPNQAASQLMSSMAVPGLPGGLDLRKLQQQR